MERKPLRPRTKTTTPVTVRARRLDAFGPPPLIAGEDAAAYDEILARIFAAQKPFDFIEEILLRESADQFWELQRLRRLRAELMAKEAHDVLVRELKKFVLDNADDARESSESDQSDASSAAFDLAAEWLQREPTAVRRVDSLLASAGLTIHSVLATVLRRNLHTFERIEHMIATLEVRLNATLRELDRRRAMRDHRPRPTLEQVEDASHNSSNRNQSPGDKAA
jgi:hypothetical protein